MRVATQIDASGYLPHKKPMAMIEYIGNLDDGSNYASLTIHDDNRFINDDGVLDATLIPELVAQGAAARDSYNHDGEVRPGFLAMGRDIHILQDIHVGDELFIIAKDENPVDNFFVITFKIFNQNEQLCSNGEITLCKF